MLGDTFSFGIISDNAAFFGVLNALQNRQVAKTLAEPNIVAVSGRPAQFVVGGEVPILIPQSLGTSSIEFKSFGTILDFLPIVLGNGNIRLEVRPQVSEKNDANGIQLNDIIVPGFDTRRVDTAVEMKAGQTFALAGLIQEKTVSRNRGLPYLADIPVIGVPFRRTENDVQEIELLVMVTPEFVDPLDCGEAPCGGPGYATTNPTNCQLYCSGHVEVPAHCNPISGLTTCGEDPCANCANGNSYGGCNGCNNGQYINNNPTPMVTDGVTMPGGIGYDEISEPATATDQDAAPTDLPLPPQPAPEAAPPEASGTDVAPMPPDGARYPSTTMPSYSARAPMAGGQPIYTATRPHNPPRQPVFLRNPSTPQNRQPATTRPAANGLIGPVGYDNQ
jgi:pilus assembly protein CpaC